MDKLRELRKKKGISQQDLANDLNISRESISKYENGEQEASYDTLRRLSKYFNVSIDYLLNNNVNDCNISEIKSSLRNLNRSELISLMEKQIDLLTLVEKNQKDE